MSRGKCPFTKLQVERAIELVHGAGYVMTGFRKHTDGFTIMTSKPDMIGKPSACNNGPADDLDHELAEFQARHGQG